jgi:hypothetical protein
VCGIFDDRYSPTCGELAKRVVITRMASEIDRHNRPCPRTDLSLDINRIDVQRVRLYIRKYRRSIFVKNAIGARDE